MNFKNIKKAFTMLELIFVIVVIGILAVAISPKMQENHLRELAHQIISDIRYTQHLAMQDNKFDPNDSEWYKKRWQIYFQPKDTTDNLYYTIWNDKNNLGNINVTEIAVDQTTKRRMTGRASYNNTYIESMDLKNEYDIKSYSLCGDTNGDKQRLYFDYLGRVYIPDGTQDGNRFKGLLENDCNLTLTNDRNQKVVITIMRETGYSYIAQVDD